MNSSYELDLPNKKIRRLQGKQLPTPRQGVDGEWRSFEDISQPTLNQELCIVWRYDHLHHEVIARSTLTSPVVEIQEILAEC